MAAENRRPPGPALRRKRRLGQSLVEFAFLMPLLLGMIFILRDVEMAINAAIVNNRYSRATLHFLLFNHRWYPEASFTTLSKGVFMRRWWLGVEDDKTETSSTKAPKAPVIKVGVKPGRDDEATGAELAQDSITSRQKVRIRATSFICLPPRGIKSDSPFQRGAMDDSSFRAPGFPFCQPE
jgi:hypothetical protein